MLWTILPDQRQWAPWAWFSYNDRPDLAFSADECQQIIDLADKQEPVAKPGRLIGDMLDPETRTVDVRSFDVQPETEWAYERLVNAVKELNTYYWQLDLSVLRTMEVLSYSPGGHYVRHVDWGGPFNTRKITVSVQLSDPNDYTDGDLILHERAEDTHLPREQGAILVFPSWTLHEVKPITSGVRRAMTAWVEGPPYR